MGFDPVEEEWFVMRVPYPMGFYTRSMGGRVDNPYIGWKGAWNLGGQRSA